MKLPRMQEAVSKMSAMMLLLPLRGGQRGHWRPFGFAASSGHLSLAELAPGGTLATVKDERFVLA